MIQFIVAQRLKGCMSEMVSPCRASDMAYRRWVAMYLSLRLTQLSMREIGRKFGDRDHSSIAHGIKRIEDLRRRDALLDHIIETLRLELEVTGY